MSKRKKKKGTCVYCGFQGPVTDDHVPPRSFYPKAPPKNLITVPSCETCNKTFAKDDDYARLVLTTAEGALGNASRNELIPIVKRFAERAESKRILRTVYESLRSGYYETPGGISIRRQQFALEGERLDAFAKRVIKGLFYLEKRYRLPDDCTIHAINHRRMSEFEDLAGPNRDFYALILTELAEHTERRSWGDVFGYSWVQSPNYSDATWWLLDFYGRPQYLCNTLRDDVASE